MKLKNPRNTRTSTKKSFDLNRFNERYFINEEACREEFFNHKFPNGYVCPECGKTTFSYVKGRNVIQCTHCSHQDCLLSGTIFQDSKLSLYQILVGIYYFVTAQSGFNGTTLATYMSVNINTSRLFLRKMRAICKTENDKDMLEQMVDLDGAYVGGVTTGEKRGLGAEKKQPILIGVEMIDTGCGYLAPHNASFKIVKSENGDEVLDFVNEFIEKGTKIRSDGGKGISVIGRLKKDDDGNIVLDENGNPIKRYNYTLENPVFDKDNALLEFVHKFISNLNALIIGTYHGVRKEFLEPLVNEFTWRFNKRFEANNMRKVHLMLDGIFNTKPLSYK